MAVVSPMPAKNEAAASSASAAASTSEEVNNAERSTKPESSHKKDDSLVNEDPLKGLVPLGPLGLFSNASRQPTCGKPTHQLPFSSKIDQFSSALSNGSGGGTTIAANATTLFQQQGSITILLCICNSIHLANANGSSYNLHILSVSLSAYYTQNSETVFRLIITV